MEGIRRLACKRCQTRKIRCNKAQPCSHCIQGNHVCEYRTIDARKRPVSQRYLSAIEARLAWFELLTQNLKKASNAERDTILADVSLDDHLGINEVEDVLDHSFSDASGDTHALSLHSGPQGNLQFHGPTSIYLATEEVESPNELHRWAAPTRHENATQSLALDASSILRLASALGIDDALIRETLPLFFLHQYPSYMFIYREAFLSDYYDNAYGGRYWSYPLLYALCALGAPHSSSAIVQAKAHLLAKCSQEIVISHCLTKPCPTTIQALLCLAFHEVGQGNASQGWLFSGMAFRMGQDIGFHQDPSRWVMQDQSIVSPEDIEIRRRIYWGSYVADKFICMYLGRPVYLREDDAAVHPSMPLPDFPSTHDWFGLSEIASQYTAPDLRRPRLIAALKQMILLGLIFQDAMMDLFSSMQKGGRNDAHRLNRLGELNLRLGKWHTSLPDELQWSQWSHNKTTHSYVIVLHLYHHALLLSLNRHFAKPSTGFPHASSSREICLSSTSIVTILIRQFRSQHKLNNAPLMLVYALVMAIITQTQTLDQGRENVGFLMRSLGECTRCYRLAAEAMARLAPCLGLSSYAFAPVPTGSMTTPAVAGAEINDHRIDQIQPGDFTEPGFGSLTLNSVLSPIISEPGDSGGDSAIDTEIFDFSGLNDVNGDFYSWFSIGNMG